MPRRRRYTKRRVPPFWKAYQELSSGPQGRWPVPGYFDTAEDMREAWTEYRDDVLGYEIYGEAVHGGTGNNGRPGDRPYAWWYFDVDDDDAPPYYARNMPSPGAPRSADAPSSYDVMHAHEEEQIRYLAENGHLSYDEVTRIVAWDDNFTRRHGGKPKCGPPGSGASLPELHQQMLARVVREVLGSSELDHTQSKERHGS